MNQQRVNIVAPVQYGQELSVIPDGEGKDKDPCFSISGFMVFVKQMPPEKKGKLIKVKIVCVKQNCAIAVYEE